MDPEVLKYFWLCLSAVIAGVMNSIAGGGTLLTFPALFSALPVAPLSATIANATSTTALLPGSLAGAWAYRAEIGESRALLKRLLLPSLIGGIVGTLLVTQLDPKIFDALVPWLILTAAMLFLVQKPIATWIRRGKPQGEPTTRTFILVTIFQFGVAVYGGYFGAGIGILMLTALSFMNLRDIHQMNALKTVLAAAINAMSVMIFVIKGAVRWDYALAMAISAIFGGYLGARVARRMPAAVVRWIVIIIGFTLAAYYFMRQAGIIG